MELQELVLLKIKEKSLTAYRIGKDLNIPNQGISELLKNRRKIENFSLVKGLKLLNYLFDETELENILKKFKKST
jgi:hypothetical protein